MAQIAGIPNLTLTFEKLASEALDLRPRMRQMHGAGIAQPDIVAFANMTGGTQANRRHPRCNGRPDAARAVLDHETFIRADAQLAGGKQKDVGMRLSPRDHIGTEDMTVDLLLECPHHKSD